ncbi:MAG TPA: hypothetical protein VLI04_22290 [Nocardioidaceae bacterium]|nr:hypothetical protein [Nocardioidaceae bacterium]
MGSEILAKEMRRGLPVELVELALLELREAAKRGPSEASDSSVLAPAVGVART